VSPTSPQSPHPEDHPILGVIMAFCGTLHDTAIGLGDAQWLARSSVDY
jgi:hypothetical protein